MSVYTSTLNIEGTHLEGENPLPMFRNKNHHREVIISEHFTEEQKLKMGYEAGERYLPYQMQDRYSRDLQKIALKTIVLENENLKAVFLPEYGGRLYSLVDKKSGRDILYKNPVFQPANLAILNAWFSGGVEWNIGQVGHAFSTCLPVQAAKLNDGEGNEFLRVYDYERCKNIFWHIDFHLPQGAKELLIYVRIVNDNKCSVPMYYWTNIAVEETEAARVFSTTSEVIYIDTDLKGHDLGHMPILPSVPETDVSYPIRFPFANEYFFQTPKNCKSPWEAIAYEDGRLFYERSTSLLRYRKMFCWGNHAGGRRWRDFLAKSGEGDYIELQGGMAPTQLNGMDMPAHTTWDFTQVMGVTTVDTNSAYDENWNNAREYIEDQVDYEIDEAEVYEINRRLQSFASMRPEEKLFSGSQWGTLEQIRREQQEHRGIPSGFSFFTEANLEAAQLPWMTLLQKGYFPTHDINDIPASWMVQDEWMELLRNSLSKVENQTWTAYLHYGVMLYEKGLEAEAIEAWESSLHIQPSVWVYRNLAEAAKRNDDLTNALAYMEQAYQVSNGFPDRAFVEEYLNLMINNKEIKRAWDLYETLPRHFAQSDRIQIILGVVALELDNDRFMENLFTTEFAVIREGEVQIVDLWYKYNAKKLAVSQNVELTDELIEQAKILYPPPTNIDFRVLGT